MTIQWLSARWETGSAHGKLPSPEKKFPTIWQPSLWRNPYGVFMPGLGVGGGSLHKTQRISVWHYARMAAEGEVR